MNQSHAKQRAAAAVRTLDAWILAACPGGPWKALEPLEVLREYFAADAPAIELLTNHRHERDDMTLDEVLSYLTSGWEKVHGRTERHLVLQLCALLAAEPEAAQGSASGRDEEQAR